MLNCEKWMNHIWGDCGLLCWAWWDLIGATPMSARYTPQEVFFYWLNWLLNPVAPSEENPCIPAKRRLCGCSNLLIRALKWKVSLCKQCLSGMFCTFLWQVCLRYYTHCINLCVLASSTTRHHNIVGKKTLWKNLIYSYIQVILSHDYHTVIQFLTNCSATI